MSKGVFITGTDTEVGKTLVSAAIMQKVKTKYDRVLGYKPVVAGLSIINGVMANEDVLVLQEMGSQKLDQEWICPYRLTNPVAPHIAADLDNIQLEPARMLSGYSRIKKQTDFIVVEGVGGFLVPINQEYDMSQFAQALELPVILVVGIRLGCLNHALLSAESIHKRGLKILGWVANCVDPKIESSVKSNINTLKKLLAPPCLGVIPYLQDAATPYTKEIIEYTKTHLDFSAIEY